MPVDPGTTLSRDQLLVVGACAVVLTLADRVLGNRSVGGLVAVGLVAVPVHPTYARLRGGVERLV